MNINEIAVGQRTMWNLLDKLGEGDAGEVYLVESTLEGKRAILKRPRQNAYTSDILRQAAQIRNEGSVLQALQTLSFPETGLNLKTPAWLDQSRPEEGQAERFFIVVERANGFDLRTMQHIARLGKAGENPTLAHDEERAFIEVITQQGEIPEAVLVRVILGAITFLEAIHSPHSWGEFPERPGLLWNDVKPEHLFWDPRHACLTVIDWGNSQYLEADRTTRDRRYAAHDDFLQLIQEMGAFLAESCPDLLARLSWPQDVTPLSVYDRGVQPLKEQLTPLQAGLLGQLQGLRQTEADLFSATRPRLDDLKRIESLQRKILALGELPDFAGTLQLHAKLLMTFASEHRLDAFQKVCERTVKLVGSSAEKWELLCEIANLALHSETGEGDRLHDPISNALAAGVADDWPALLWQLAELHVGQPLPGWWENISQRVRRVYLKLDAEALPPSVEVRRIFYTLEAAVRERSDRAGESGSTRNDNDYENLLKTLDEEVVKKWRGIDPAPPHSGIGYTELDGYIQDIESICPGTQAKLEKVLAQSKAQAEIALSAWDRKDFERARRALHMLLIWDPDRRRLFRADLAIAAAPQWLAQVNQGAGAAEPFYDYITRVELAGWGLRNQVGPADWLDMILDALKRLRKGTRQADLIMDHPHILNEIPWLSEYRSREALTLPRSRPLRLERESSSSGASGLITGMVEGKLGKEKDLHLIESLDTWAPEARGSSARVFAGHLRSQAGQPVPAAIKIIRPDSMEYALPLFREEAQILTLLRDIPGVTPLLECGYLRLRSGMAFPSEEDHAAAGHLRGEIVRFGVEETQNYLASMERYLAQSWLPYLAIVQRDQEYNLIKYCDAGYTHGWFLPLRESLLLAIQICDILQNAHDRNIMYRDHKILHYYWDLQSHGVVMIDWNIAKRQPQGLSDAEAQFDLVQFGARALHHILTGRPATGALPLGPNRPEEIESSAMTYPVNWTFDDERLPNRVKEIVEQVLNQGYSHFKDLRSDLLLVYQQIPDAAS